MNANRGNGAFECPVREDWEEHKEDITHLVNSMAHVLSYAKHLEKLDQLDIIANSITSMEVRLLNAATGRDQVPTEVVQKMLGVVTTANTRIMWVFSSIAVGLLTVIVFLLTGAKLGILPPLHG